MTCTVPGIIASAFSLVSLIIAACTLGIPIWSMRSIGVVGSDLISQFSSRFTYQSNFNAGVWGVCEDTSAMSNSTADKVTLHTCHMYFTSYQLETAQQLSNQNIVIKNSTASLCQNNEIVSSASEELRNGTLVSTGYSPSILKLFSQTSSGKSSFLSATCGNLGKFTLALTCLELIFSIFMTALLLLGLICCKTATIVVSCAGFLGLFSSLFCFMSTISWAVQISYIDSNTMTYGPCFGFNILNMFFFLFGAFACFRHVKKGKGSDAANEISMTRKRTPMVRGKKSNLV